MRRACLASAVRAASARNCEILKSWWVISIADMLPAPRINDICIESQLRRFGNPPTSQVLRRLVLEQRYCARRHRQEESSLRPGLHRPAGSWAKTFSFEPLLM